MTIGIIIILIQICSIWSCRCFCFFHSEIKRSPPAEDVACVLAFDLKLWCQSTAHFVGVSHAIYQLKSKLILWPLSMDIMGSSSAGYRQVLGASSTYLVLLTEGKWHLYIASVNWAIIGSDNGLSPFWRQAIIWTNDGLLFIWSLRTNFSEIWIKIHWISFKKIHLEMSSAKCPLFCLSLKLKVLTEPA